MRFGPRLLVPDLSGWRVERVSELPDQNPLTIVPDWCCEVLSPGSTARTDRLKKLPRYLAARIRLKTHTPSAIVATTTPTAIHPSDDTRLSASKSRCPK